MHTTKVISKYELATKTLRLSCMTQGGHEIWHTCYLLLQSFYQTSP